MVFHEFHTVVHWTVQYAFQMGISMATLVNYNIKFRADAIIIIMSASNMTINNNTISELLSPGR